jgi:hypothetical protein
MVSGLSQNNNALRSQGQLGDFVWGKNFKVSVFWCDFKYNGWSATGAYNEWLIINNE